MNKARHVPKGKLRYALESGNRLSVMTSAGPLRVNGNFIVDEHNRLVFSLNEPIAWRRRYDLPERIVFEGKISLDKNHDLLLVLDETPSQEEGGKLLIKGEIVSALGDAFLFQCNSVTTDGSSHLRLLRFRGKWQSDEYNRLIFSLTKKAKPSTLILNGAWQINERQQIFLHYEKTDLITKKKKECILVFDGFWQLAQRSRLRYILEGSRESFFDFRVQLESPTMYPQKGLIKYRVGIGAKKNSKERTFSLFGTWKFGRRLGVGFQMDMGKGIFKEMRFDAKVSLSDKDDIVLELVNAKGQPLGLRLRYSRCILNDSNAQAFLQFKKAQDEAGIECGVRIPF